MTGVVKSFIPKKGYGFIKGHNGEEYFFHRMQVDDKPHTVYPGETVIFTARQTETGNRAIHIRRLEGG